MVKEKTIVILIAVVAALVVIGPHLGSFLNGCPALTFLVGNFTGNTYTNGAPAGIYYGSCTVNNVSAVYDYSMIYSTGTTFSNGAAYNLGFDLQVPINFSSVSAIQANNNQQIGYFINWGNSNCIASGNAGTGCPPIPANGNYTIRAALSQTNDYASSTFGPVSTTTIPPTTTIAQQTQQGGSTGPTTTIQPTVQQAPGPTPAAQPSTDPITAFFNAIINFFASLFGGHQ